MRIFLDHNPSSMLTPASLAPAFNLSRDPFYAGCLGAGCWGDQDRQWGEGRESTGGVWEGVWHTNRTGMNSKEYFIRPPHICTSLPVSVCSPLLISYILSPSLSLCLYLSLSLSLCLSENRWINNHIHSSKPCCEGIHSSLVGRWTTSQKPKQSSLHQGHDS